jgi:serine phosphatase RsbU (regulator of sigma subunit)
LNNILAKRSHRGLFDTASYILLDVENRKLNICNARHHGLMIRRDENILEADKAGRIPLGVVENDNYIEEFFFHHYWEFWYSFIRTGRWSR